MNEQNLATDFATVVKKLDMQELVEAILVARTGNLQIKREVSAHSFSQTVTDLEWLISTATELGKLN